MTRPTHYKLVNRSCSGSKSKERAGIAADSHPAGTPEATGVERRLPRGNGQRLSRGEWAGFPSEPRNLDFLQEGTITAFLPVSLTCGGIRKPPRFVGLSTLPNPEQGMRIHEVGRTSRLQMG
jgi:hypothetical protein